MPSLLPSVWKVPPQFVARLGDQVGRQRAMFAEAMIEHEKKIAKGRMKEATIRGNKTRHQADSPAVVTLSQSGPVVDSSAEITLSQPRRVSVGVAAKDFSTPRSQSENRVCDSSHYNTCNRDQNRDSILRHLQHFDFERSKR